jgi:FMN phosphatase YigB (HAD superfamily)
MKVRAVILDLYKTLLEVGPPPADAEERWEFLWEDMLADAARLTLSEFAEGCEKIIAEEHSLARGLGIQNPEIYWPAVARRVLPELERLQETELDTFLLRHAQLQRTIRLMPGAAEALLELRARKLFLGIISNSQPYTVRELDLALGETGLDRSLFHPELCFWSYQAGFSKPNPHVFRWISTRLRILGILPAETLMIGDRLDNDILPAKAQEWKTWQLLPERGGPNQSDQGTWFDLREALVSGKI